MNGDMRSERPRPFPDRRSSIPARRDRATLTLLTGLNAGQVLELASRENVVGRGADTAMSLVDPDVSRKHARFVRTEDGRFFVEDLGSKNGVFVGGRRVDRVELRPGDRLHLGASVTLRFDVMDAADHDQQRRIFEATRRDPLTQTCSRGHFRERIVSEVDEARRNGTELAVLMVDLDAFPQLTAKHGAAAGDEALREVGAELLRIVPGEDAVARYAGEAFAILVRDVAPSIARLLGDRLQRAIELLPIDASGVDVSVTASIGVACFSELGRFARPMDLVALAEKRASEARRAGRNRVCAGGVA